MREDFTKAVKDTLSQRVGLLCSNPECMRLTIGPNSAETKSTNIGVAAHITAASPGGPRFDKNMESIERCSISNGIWLCQSCAKLIDSDESKYTVNLLVKWKNLAESHAESHAESQLNERQIPQDKYKKIFDQIPDLINEMADDLVKDPLAREFVLLGKNWGYNDKGGVLRVCTPSNPTYPSKFLSINCGSRYFSSEGFVSLMFCMA